MKHFLLLFTILFAFNFAFATPDWKRTNYTQSSTFTATVEINGTYAEAGDIVGIFVGEECRMIAEVFINDGVAYISSVLHGETQETATVKLWIAAEDKIIEGEQNISTKPMGEINLFPLQFKSGSAATATKNTAVELKVSPTPFTDELSVKTSKDVKTVTFINFIGQKVQLPANQEGNNYTFNSSNLLSGIYYISIEFVDGTTTTKQIIKK